VRLSPGLRDGRLCIRAAGWTAGELERLRAAGPDRLLAVLPSELVAAAPGLAPTAGRFELAGDEVWFAPRHPLRAGLRYSLLWTPDAAELGSVALPDARAEPATSVREIHPTCPEIPHNLLRLYVSFSGPMSEGFADRALRVVDEATGEALDGALLPMEPELWDPGHRRLTALFDPGRIKRGLRPHEEIGYPLRPGQTVVVVVSGELRDAAGRRLVAPATRRYRVGPAERRRVDPALWRWTWPGGPGEPVHVVFDRPLDHALVRRCLRVRDAAGADLPVEVEVGPAEGGASVRPAVPWRRGERCRVMIDTRLEDLAGNSLRRVFDRDLERPEDAPSSPAARTVDFVCDW
jgi:hypothetical protein